MGYGNIFVEVGSVRYLCYEYSCTDFVFPVQSMRHKFQNYHWNCDIIQMSHYFPIPELTGRDQHN